MRQLFIVAVLAPTFCCKEFSRPLLWSLFCCFIQHISFDLKTSVISERQRFGMLIFLWKVIIIFADWQKSPVGFGRHGGEGGVRYLVIHGWVREQKARWTMCVQNWGLCQSTTKQGRSFLESILFLLQDVARKLPKYHKQTTLQDVETKLSVCHLLGNSAKHKYFNTCIIPSFSL